jgi:hypothetical protein
MDIQQSMLRSYHTFAKSHPPKISDFFNTHSPLHSLTCLDQITDDPEAERQAVRGVRYRRASPVSRLLVEW